MSNPKFIIIFCLGALAIGFILYIMNPTPEDYGVPNEVIPSGVNQNNSSTPNFLPPGAIMEDGTL